MAKTAIDKRILEAAQKVTSKRPKTVIDHIIKHGHITTEELKDVYGYDHPPRAARDVREQGIPLETFKVENKEGKAIAAYRFGNPDDIEGHKLGGRKVFSKKFKVQLVEMYGERCFLTNEAYEERYLQIDHRIPYEVAGESAGCEQTPEAFMLLSAGAQRQKSWSCEHCENFTTKKQKEICTSCYWAFPEKYTHVAMQQERRIDLVWRGDAAKSYDAMASEAKKSKVPLQDFIKNLLAKLTR